MKFMLMMNAPRGNGDWGVVKWSQDDLKAHINFMRGSARSSATPVSSSAPKGLAPRARPGWCGRARAAPPR